MGRKIPKFTTSIVANSMLKGTSVLPNAKKRGMKLVAKK